MALGLEFTVTVTASVAVQDPSVAVTVKVVVLPGLTVLEVPEPDGLQVSVTGPAKPDVLAVNVAELPWQIDKLFPRETLH